MATKKRSFQHLMESDSYDIVRRSLPRSWVIREYRPDYGLDLAIEVFDDFSEAGQAETLAEHFFVQVKSVTDFDLKSISVAPRSNVTKPKPDSFNARTADAVRIDVVKFSVDTSLLQTVQRMGASSVVFLFLVSITARRVLFVCLNDYVDKIVVPENRSYGAQSTLTLNIPMKNELSSLAEHQSALSVVKFFAKRAKFYTAFNLFAYQFHELSYCSSHEARRITAQHFLDHLLLLDIWQGHDWSIVSDYHRWLTHLKAVLPGVPEDDYFSSHPFTEWEIDHSMSREVILDQDIQNFWHGLNVLSRNYEEICREWNQPTNVAAALADW